MDRIPPVMIIITQMNVLTRTAIVLPFLRKNLHPCSGDIITSMNTDELTIRECGRGGGGCS